MSANKAEISRSKIWLRTPENARISFLLVLLVTIIKLPLTKSLWLDEGITAWITRDSIFAAMTRATNYQGQSPFYFVISWFWQLLIGSSELALRIPSLAGVLGAALILFLIARRMGGAAYGWLAAAVFLTIDPVQVAAVSARPYGLALFFSIAAVWALQRWEERGSYRFSVLFLFCFLASVYLQYLFGAMLAIHALHVLLHYKSQRVKLVSYFFQLLLIAALLFPAFLHMVDMSQNASAWQYVPAPNFVSVSRALFPPALVICAVGSMLFGLLLGKGREYSLEGSWRERIWVAVWYLLPPGVMLVLSLVTTSSLFFDRYFLFYAPAVALAFAAIPFVLKNEYTRSVTILAFVSLLLLRNIDREWKLENWRGAAELAQSEGVQVPVLIYSGLAETKDVSWLRDEKKQDYLQAPLRYYGLSNITALIPPPNDREDTKEYIDTMTSRLIAGSKRALFIGLDRKYRGKSIVETWIEKLGEKGFKAKEISLGKDSTVRAFRLAYE